MNPKINTSLRGRGKWGDFLVAILPLSWCANILLNSNFILRMFEWQNESSLFTVRIHGKQWYWVYKFDLIDAIDILTVPKNIGNNRWVVGTPEELTVCESYLQAIQLRSQEDWIKNYWRKKLESDIRSFKNVGLGIIQSYIKIDSIDLLYQIKNSNNLSSNYANMFNALQKDLFVVGGVKFDYTYIFTKLRLIFPRYMAILNWSDELTNIFDRLLGRPVSFYKFSKYLNLYYAVHFPDAMEFGSINTFKKRIGKFLLGSKLVTNVNHINSFLSPQIFSKNDVTDNLYYNYDELDDTWDVEYSLRHLSPIGPIRLVKHLLTQDYLKDNTALLKFNFFDNSNQTSLKIPDNDNFWVLKQKRYKKKQLVKSSYSKNVEYCDFETIRNIYRKHIIENIKLITDLDFKMDPYTLYKCIRGNRNKTETLPIYLYRRLLRTKRTLVLPVHINMTVVTNSYDVVHSWFLPGLGIKMDCVPGRSTHHSLYLDNIGFYYGQCAEICGRYHHHMPIRLCALPFEHFLVWWQLKGLPKLLRLKTDKTKLINYTLLKYTW